MGAEALRGRTAIVTGACRSAGAAASHALSRAGVGVVLADSDRRELEELAACLTAEGGRAVAVPADVTDPRSVRRLVEQTMGAFGRLDVAVNDAGADGVAVAMTYELPPMRRAGRGGIVNLTTSPAVIALTRAAAQAVGGTGIRISAAAEPAEAVGWLSTLSDG